MYQRSAAPCCCAAVFVILVTAIVVLKYRANIKTTAAAPPYVLVLNPLISNDSRQPADGPRLTTSFTRDSQSSLVFQRPVDLPNKSSTSPYALIASGRLLASDPRLIAFIKDRLARPSLHPRSLSDNTNRSHFSQVGQSMFVDKLLSGRTNGFFIECGAGDGEYTSNSLFFELRRNWTGILIEANPLEYRSMLSKRRKVYSLPACLSIERRASMMKMRLAGDSGGLVETLDTFQMKVESVLDGFDLDLICYPLNSVLEAIGVNHVDYFSLDIEGAELGVLKTIDWAKVRIDVITVEVHIGGLPNNEEGRAQKQGKYNQLYRFLISTGLYKQVAFLPVSAQEAWQAHDVVFARLDKKT